MVLDLNAHRRPAQFRAEPWTQGGTTLQADVYTFHYEGGKQTFAEGNGEGGVATAVWAPPAPPLSAEVEFGTLDIYEVNIYKRSGTRTIVAAIELLSPANKDRPPIAKRSQRNVPPICSRASAS